MLAGGRGGHGAKMLIAIYISSTIYFISIDKKCAN
jgi:hypothetical protein